MARPLRIDIPDGVYHVTSRGLERREIVADDVDREKWTDLLDRVATRCRWRVFAWVLMGNHYHVFLQTPDANLSAGMHDLNSGYVSGHNRRHGRCGPLLQGRFKAILVESDRHEWELSRYVHLNPVRAGLVKAPAGYRWGSCRFYLREGGAPEWLAWEDVLAGHGRTLRAARGAYARFLAEGTASPAPSPLRAVVASTLLGSEGFVARMRRWLEGRLPAREVPAARQLRGRLDLRDVDAAVAEVFGVPVDSLHVRGHWHNDARGVAMYLARRSTGASVVSLGERYGGVCGQAASVIVRQLAERLRTDSRLAGAVLACENRLGKN
jgi:REP element-mobilizing transposase RayT